MSSYTPYWYQQEAIDAPLDNWEKNGLDNCLIVAPTGSGKSVIIACFCEQVITKWPETKILIVSHVKEILKQNYETIKRQLPAVNIGLYSAGLNRRTIDSITIAGIQSVFQKQYLFKDFNIIMVDEAHAVSFEKNSRYRKFLDYLNKPTIGLTATHFRLKGGYLHTGDNAYFQSIAYEIDMKLLQKEGKLCQLRQPGTKTRMDTSGIRKQHGDFIPKELSLAFDREKITEKIVMELLPYKNLRKKWLGFGIDINHCENITKELNKKGIKAKCLHSKIKPGLRNKIIQEYRDSKYQALISVAMLTTGFDVKDIDLVFCARPTSSLVLHIQIPGRGMRVFPGKNDCLYLDFAGNLHRNGPIDSPAVNDEGLKKKKGEALMKECEKCLEIVPIAVRVCPNCGTEFLFKHHLTSSASDAAIMTVEAWHKVKKVSYSVCKNKDDISYLKVNYFCGLRKFSEPICFEHTGFPKTYAKYWWKRRTSVLPPRTSQEAKILSGQLKIPSEILVAEGGKYPKIKDSILN